MFDWGTNQPVAWLVPHIHTFAGWQMLKRFIKQVLVVAICGLLLPACQYIQPPAATHDANQLYTQVANTMAAGLLATRQAQPSATPEPTLTAAPLPETTTPPAPANTPENTPPGPDAAQTSTPPGSTPAAAPLRPGDQAEFVYHSPGKGLRVHKNSAWTLTLNIKNTGTQTWNSAYFLAYSSGERMGSPDDYFLTQPVKPDETYTFVFGMQAPNETGKKKEILTFKHDLGNELLYIDFDVNVVD